jgi:Zn-finger nucleic acid-binding protein
MARVGEGHRHHREKELDCPRCHRAMQEVLVKEAHIDRCGRCDGVFFDQGEMFLALGATADASYWDRDGVASATRVAEAHCPRCHASFHLQDIEHGGEKVEIDRCAGCGGIWLDAGESEKILRIGAAMADRVRAEQAAAQADLDKMGDVDFRAGGLLYKFLSLFRGKKSD